MRELASGKTPDSDGLPQEFYSKFWNILSPHLPTVYNYSFMTGCFSKPMQESATHLIFKKGNRKNLKNWRPISLLNVDSKICSKALANHLSKVLSSIVPDRLALPDATAKLIVCVAFNATRVADVQRSQLASSAKVLGIKKLQKLKDKAILLQAVAQGLLDKGYIKVLGNLKNPSRNETRK